MLIKKHNSGRRQHANVTASDVAQRAGVSPMTVSRVINGEASVRSSTRSSVNQAIKELGYSPNKAARSLARANQIRVSLLYSNPNSTYLSAMLLGVLEQVHQSDTQISVVECTTGFDVDAAIQSLIEDRVDGVILAPPLCDSLQAFETLKNHNVPTVTMGAQHAEDKISSVNIDDFRAADTMTRHIISLGHRRIGFIIGNPEQSASILRLAGFRNAMQEAGLDTSVELTIQGEFSYRSGFEAAEQLLSLDAKPTAILASNDDMAAGVIAAAHRMSIDVPGSLTVCGFDNTLLATTIWPEITTINQPIADMTTAAIGLLERNIRRQHSGLAIKSQRLKLEFSLVKRQSDAVLITTGEDRGNK